MARPIVAVAILCVPFILIFSSDAYAHSSTGPVIIYPQVYHVQPGQALTHDVRVCLLTGEEFAINSITFRGNSSTWAKAEQDFPVQAPAAADGASGVDIPVTISVPSNYTGSHTSIQVFVDIPAVADASAAMAGIPVLISDTPSSQQTLPDCNSFRDLQTAILYAIVILIAVGAALIALGYFVYRRSKGKSKEHRASRLAKAFSILFIVIGSLLILAGMFLFVVQIIL